MVIDGVTGAEVWRSRVVKASSVAIAPSGDLIAIGSWDGTISLCDPSHHGEPRVLTCAGGMVSALAFSADGTVLASACSDVVPVSLTPGVGGWIERDLPGERRPGGSVELWRTASSEMLWCVTDAHAGGARAIAISPDQRWVASAGKDLTVRVWDRSDGRPVAQTRELPVERWESLGFSPDGSMLVGSGHGGGPDGGDHNEACLWSTKDWSLRFRLTLPCYGAGTCAFSPDGTVLLVDHGLSLGFWDPASGRLIGENCDQHRTTPAWVGFTDAGRSVLYIEAMGSALSGPTREAMMKPDLLLRRE